MRCRAGAAAGALERTAAGTVPPTKLLAQGLREAFELRELELSRKILEHRVARGEGLVQRGCVPRMQMRAQLGATAVQLPQDGRGPGVDGHLVRGEIGRSHSE